MVGWSVSLPFLAPDVPVRVPIEKMMKACWVGLQTDPTLGHIDEKRIQGDSDINYIKLV